MLLRIMLLVGMVAFAGTATAALDCAGVAQFVLPDVRIETAEVVADPAPHCKVVGVIGPEIRFELLLPDEWNGKFLMGGGGGFVGSVQNSALLFSEPLQRGFVTVGTDTGHQAPGIDASWALNNLERQVNFGHVAVHRTAEVSKAIAQLHYGAAVAHSYFIGCSRGGGQALMSAQRYPADFDGIIAGAPAYNWMGIAAHGVQVQRLMYPDPSALGTAVVSADNLRLLQREILAVCDGLDGLEDGVLNDPRQCSFDPDDVPSCVEDVVGPECLTVAQRGVLEAVYQGAYDSAGNRIIAGYPYGGEGVEGGWIPWIVGGSTPIAPGVPTLMFGFSTGIFKYFIHQDPDWVYTTQSFDNFAELSRLAGSVLNATNPDLSAFSKRGGKLLMWHGWSDPALSANASVEYYEAVRAGDAQADDYLRLFMLPGVLHCGGGPGPYLVDYVSPIENWVENGEPPTKLIAGYAGEDGSPSGGRPICAYPETARHTGGDSRQPGNFVCENHSER